MVYFIKENAQLQKESHQSLSSSMVGKEQRGTRRGDTPELNPAQSSYISMVMNQLQLIVQTARPPPFLRPQVSMAKGQPHLYGCESSISMVSSPPPSLWPKVSHISMIASPPSLWYQVLHHLYGHKSSLPYTLQALQQLCGPVSPPGTPQSL